MTSEVLQARLDAFLDRGTDWLVGFEHGRNVRKVRDNRRAAGLVQRRRRFTSTIVSDLVQHLRSGGYEPDIEQLAAGVVFGLKRRR